MNSGKSEKHEIAETFRLHFQTNAQPNNQQKVDDVNRKFKSAYEQFHASHESKCQCDKFDVTLENVFDAVHTLKAGKSADDDGISAEHILFAPLTFIIELQKLFRAMIRHSFVPTQFSRGTIVPIVKDQQGNRGEVSNYRGITISPIISRFSNMH